MVELNGDLSHYYYRGISQGRYVAFVYLLSPPAWTLLCCCLRCVYDINSVLCACRPVPPDSFLPRVLGKVGHMHQRMCRQHGDLSANVLDDDPATDWDARGVTWQAFEYAKPALAGGLSSRCVQQLAC